MSSKREARAAPDPAPVEAPLEATRAAGLPSLAPPAEADFLVLLSTPRPPPSWPAEPSFVATCVDARHPSLAGRVRARWVDAAPDAPEEAREWWVPTLHGLSIRVGDRLLLSRASGLSEPVVVGVIDGFLPRPAPDPATAAKLELKPDEALTVTDQDGQALLHITRTEQGPVLRLLHSDTRIDLDGRLTITAAELTLKARAGDVQIEASDRVTLSGETVHLN